MIAMPETDPVRAAAEEARRAAKLAAAAAKPAPKPKPAGGE